MSGVTRVQFTKHSVTDIFTKKRVSHHPTQRLLQDPDITLFHLRDWYKIRMSRQFDANVLCMLLTITDLVLALVVGLPVGLHLTWVEYFQAQSGALFYTRYIEYFLFE